MRLPSRLKSAIGFVLPESEGDRVAVGIAAALALVLAVASLFVGRAGSSRHRAVAGSVVEGMIQRREARDTSWTTIGPGDPIYFGDTWHALKREPAAVLLKNGRRIDLDGGAIVRLEGLTDAGGEVSLYAGRLRRTAGLVVHEKEQLRVAPAPEGVYLGIPQLVIGK